MLGQLTVRRLCIDQFHTGLQVKLHQLTLRRQNQLLQQATLPRERNLRRHHVVGNFFEFPVFPFVCPTANQESHSSQLFRYVQTIVHFGLESLNPMGHQSVGKKCLGRCRQLCRINCLESGFQKNIEDFAQSQV